MGGRFCLDIMLKCHPEAVFFLPRELKLKCATSPPVLR